MSSDQRTALPKKYKSQESEQKWSQQWDRDQVYRYQAQSTAPRYIIDTPPPTVSGSLHVGHVFSYTQTDILARFQRMQGKNVFYPIGWDDNGLPTERRVQNLYGISCNPRAPHDPEWEPVELSKKELEKQGKREVSRENFLKACQKQTQIDEKKYEDLWKRLGLSYDWSQQYSTIDPHCQKVSQASFLDLFHNPKKYVYSSDAPTMWDTTFQTAVAQAEVEERKKGGHYHDIQFKTAGGEVFTISTTRPELLPACIAVVAHPDDERYQHLFGQKAITPLFKAEVEIMPSEHADPEKGTGILMVCTFGDTADVDFWKQQDLPLKQIIGRSGKLIEVQFGQGVFQSQAADKAQDYYNQLVGLYAKQARKKVADFLKESGDLVGDPKPTEQMAKFYEKGDEPLEFISTRQWFVKILDHKEMLIEQGRKVKWQPEHMFKRYQIWVEGLNQDWCISRQRFFGVPFPVWYPLDQSGEPLYDQPIVARMDQLPVDPQAMAPEGYREDQRGLPGGFIGDPDVMDTWATSSVTPQINSHWSVDKNRHAQLFPADLRPQAHEIIRTWAFYTIVKAAYHHQEIPWKNIAISGWVVNPDRKKMSKSKGNTVTPEELIETYSSDALRYWAGKAKLGQDTIYDENVFKIGQRLTTKLFNVSKFVLMQLENEQGEREKFGADLITEKIDQNWKNYIDLVTFQATQDLENYRYAHALSLIESAFWRFCDFYVELVKSRAYQLKNSQQGQSACATLSYSLEIFLKLFAPYMPFITEEIYAGSFSKGESLHQSSWPKINETPGYNAEVLELAEKVLNEIRGAKSNAKKSLKWPVEKINVVCPSDQLQYLELSFSDLARAGGLREGRKIDWRESLDDQTQVLVELSETKE